MRLTDEPGSASFYFNDNVYALNGKEMVYTTPNGISVLDLQTFKTRPVVEGKVWVIAAAFKTQITPGQKWVSFHSNMFGAMYVFTVEAATSADRPKARSSADRSIPPQP